MREVTERLARRFPQDVAAAAVDSLVECGLLDDAAFAEWLTRSRTGSRPLASGRIAAELEGMGVDREAISRALAGVDDEANARAYAERASGSIPRDDPDAFARRLAGRLARRGFSDEVVGSVVGEACRSAAAAAGAPAASGL